MASVQCTYLASVLCVGALALADKPSAVLPATVLCTWCMLCHFVCMYCKYILLLYCILKLNYTYDKFICVEYSMDFQLGCVDCKSSLAITKRFIAVTYTPACTYMYVRMYYIRYLYVTVYSNGETEVYCSD